jgi:hypothetical protein
MSATVRETRAYAAECGIVRAPARSKSARFLHAQREALLSQFNGHLDPLTAIKVERLTRLLLAFEEADRHGRDVTTEQLDRLDADLLRNEKLFSLLDRLGAGAVPDGVAA